MALQARRSLNPCSVCRTATSSRFAAGFRAFLRSHLSARDSPATDPHTSASSAGFHLPAHAAGECLRPPCHRTSTSLVIGRFTDFVFTTDVLYRPSPFDRFQDRDDLMFAEFALPH